MGGNALKNTFTRRYEKDEFFTLEREIVEKLSIATGKRVESLKAYRAKETFGDMDILIESENRDYKALITELFQPNQIHKNGTVYSFDVNELQIDLITTTKEHFQTSVTYFAWNDLGNLMGRIYKKFGFKYGHKGLFYVMRSGDYVFREIMVSQNPEKIFQFGDYNYTQFLEGFDELEDMFRFVPTSKYFNKDIFLMHNRNHKSRVRDAKRPSYTAFLKFCETLIDVPHYEWKSNLTKGYYLEDDEHQKFLDKSFEMFDGWRERYDEALKDFENARIFKSKYSGEQVMYLTGLYRNELGQFMQFVKKRNNDLRSFVVESNTQEITDFVLEELQEFKNEKRSV